VREHVDSSWPVLELLVSTQPGGGPQHVYALATGLRARGFTSVIGAPRDGALFDRFVTAGFETIEVATDRLRPATVARVAQIVRERGIRLIHSHGKGAGLYGRLVARACSVPAVHTFHGLHFEGYAAPMRAAYLALERRLARWTRTIVNVSRAQEAEGLALKLFSAAQSRVVPNGVDVDRIAVEAMAPSAARTELGLPRDATVIGCAARLDPVKRLDLLIEATARVRGAVLVIIGRGADMERLSLTARACRVEDRVRFAGEIPDAWRLFRAFDVYVASSAKEGMPIAVLEAMALGLPVVAADIPAHREVLPPSASLTVPATPEALGTVIGDVLADIRRRAELGAANREHVRAHFGLSPMLDGIERIYRDAVTV
jgi:glycosyltransferase involved in cell wall biosynthesis